MPETIFSSPLEYAAACAVLMVAQMVYVLLGFGAGLIAVGSLALLFPEIRDVVVLLLLVSLPAEVGVVAGTWRTVRWPSIAGIGAGLLVGIPAGTAILRAGEPTLLLTVLGVFLVLVGVVFLALPRPRRTRWPAWSAPPVGVVSGVLTGLFGTGGPPLIVYFHLAGLGKSAFRGHLMAIFLAMTFVRVPAYAVGGLITLPRLVSGLAVLPAVALGAWLGHRIHLRVSETTFRRLVSAMLVVLGTLLLLRG
jgi:uncharacterized membrane protein YfcA